MRKKKSVFVNIASKFSKELTPDMIETYSVLQLVLHRNWNLVESGTNRGLHAYIWITRIQKGSIS